MESASVGGDRRGRVGGLVGSAVGRGEGAKEGGGKEGGKEGKKEGGLVELGLGVGALVGGGGMYACAT